MVEDSDKTIWRVSLPSKWPKAPKWISFSTLSIFEACPRRWALCAAEYPLVWKQRGSALEGNIVHVVLQKITSALVQRGCPSLSDESAILTLKELGGFSTIILECIEHVLKQYEGNPRAIPVIEWIRRRLVTRVPELRSHIQRHLPRIRLESCRTSQRVAKSNLGGHSLSFKAGILLRG